MNSRLLRLMAQWRRLKALQGEPGAGRSVRITSDKNKLNLRVLKYAGKTGTLKQPIGDRAWDVTFKGRIGGIASFDVSEFEVLHEPQQEAQ